MMKMEPMIKTKPMMKTELMIKTKPMKTKPMMKETKSLYSAAHSMMKAKLVFRCLLEEGDQANDKDEAYVPLLT